MSATAAKTRLTWGDLTAREPLLRALLKEIRAIRPKPGKRWCANAIWYGYADPADSFKERMSQLVGWDRRGDPVLGTMDAYDVAYKTLYNALPDCRHESIFC
jgi:hypothetical protein